MQVRNIFINNLFIEKLYYMLYNVNKFFERMFSMKKFVAILMSLLVLVSIAGVSASALESAKTAVSVKKGDEVIYTLKLTTPEKVVGCDFSVYYDSSVLKIKEYADFTGNFDADEHQAVINPGLKDELIGNWSILSGVSFDNRTVVSVKFQATSDAETHVSYYVRYLYPESLKQFTDYTFKCDVKVNGKKVIDNKAPELNVEVQQPHGQFINSVTGDGEDADVNTAQGGQQGGNNGGEISENDVKNDTKDNKDTNNNKDTTKDDKKDKDTEETTVSNIGAASSPDSVTTSTPSQTDENGGIFTSIWFWVIIGLVVVGGGAAAFYVTKNKKEKSE